MLQREVDADAARRRERARLLQLVEGELRAVVARVEALGAEVHGVGAVGDGGPDGVERAGGGEQFGGAAGGSASRER